MEKRQAEAYWQRGVFCIRLLKEPSNRKFQEVVLGIDPGSKREGYTVLTKKAVVLNITTDTPWWVKKHMATRRMLRRVRRQRHAPYRQWRPNRAASSKPGRISPSTKARWGAKLRILRSLLKILPITSVNVEDIKAISKEGKTEWNLSFSPLEIGKAWFYSEIDDIGISLLKTSGSNTKKHRDKRGFTKSRNKLAYTWEAHNVDSHTLAEMVLQAEVVPFRGLYQLNFHQFHRRSLHLQSAGKKGLRRGNGSTISLGIPRGSIVRYKQRLYYLGGMNKKNRACLMSIATKKIANDCRKASIEVLYNAKWRTQYVPN